jgi:hypothetical protein
VSAEKLLRTNYRDPIGNLPRAGAVACAEALVDVDNYERLLEQVHGSCLHEWGVGQGLGASATVGQADLTLQAGVAVDFAGRHASLAPGGKAETNPNITNPGELPRPVDVSGAGLLTFPTAALGLAAGSYYFTMQWWETPFTDQVNGIFQLNHTPWLRLQPVGPFTNNGADGVVLAKVTLDAAGKVTALTADLRRHVSLPVQSVHLRRPQSVSAASVDNLPSGQVSAHPAGGIQLRGQNAGDQVHFVRSDGSESVSIAADSGTVAAGAPGIGGTVALSDGGSTSVLLDGGYATVTVGRAGNWGEIDVYDDNGHLAVASNGARSLVTVGGTNNPGIIRTFDGGRNTTVQIEAATGVARLKRLAAIEERSNAIDVDARFFHIHAWDLTLDGRSGGNKRALVDLNNQLQVNFANDYANGVVVNGLHLADHVKTGYWEVDNNNWNPGTNQWITFFELDTGLPASEWSSASLCEIGMYAGGFVVFNFWWTFQNTSYVSPAGTIVIRWAINYNNGQDDDPFFPSNLAVLWFAFRN